MTEELRSSTTSKASQTTKSKLTPPSLDETRGGSGLLVASGRALVESVHGIKNVRLRWAH